MGNNKVVIDDIARIAGVSKATVSRVINGTEGKYSEEVKMRVRRAIKETGYTPSNTARSLARRKSRTIGLIVPYRNVVFYMTLSQAIQEVLYQNDYQALICYARYDKKSMEDIVRSLLSYPVEGIITICGEPDIDDVPVVHVDHHSHDFEHYGVYFPNRAITYNMSAMFYECGHRDIATIAGPMFASTGVYRLEGYMKYLGQRGLNMPLAAYGDYTIDSGYKAADELLKTGRPFTALISANDEMAMGAMYRLKEEGIRIPEDVEIMGIDDNTMAKYATPALSTVSQTATEMGREAAELLLEILRSNKDIPGLVRRKIDAEWIFRGSTKPACEEFYKKHKEEFDKGIEVPL